MRPNLVVAVLALAAASAFAQAPQQPFFNVITLETSATADVPTDTLTVTLFVEEQGPDPGQLASRVNARLDDALARAKKEPRVEARSGNYQTTPIYDRANQITGWRIRADVVLESRDFKAVAALAGALQPALKLWSMTFSLSRGAREAAEATLLTEALAKFQEKARAVAKGLGFPGYVLGQINVRSEGPMPPIAHRGVAMVALIGSVPAGRAVMRAASDTVKPLLLELGGKNALIAYPDADPDDVAAGAVGGMNFTWCGQSCGSTSRAFVHHAIYDTVIERVKARVAAFRPGLATDPATTMGAIVSAAQLERVLGYIESARSEGARLVCGGNRPSDPALRRGFFVEPTVFCDVTQSMRIAREEIFGPVLAIMPWADEAQMLQQVNAVDYGLTCSIWTRDLDTALRTAASVQAGYVWINEVGRHFLGAPFGGVKQSGLGREECLAELLAFTQEKNIHVRLTRRAG